VTCVQDIRQCPRKDSRPSQSQYFGALTSPSSQVRPTSTLVRRDARYDLNVGAVSCDVPSMTSPSLATISTKRGGGGRFCDLWTMSLDSAGASKPAGRRREGPGEEGPSCDLSYAG
jgi:hypothetical protein